ncbi:MULTISPECIES: carbohydrate ABC transporter permease [unclassified Microbacterium]|uniref:carbohydrate ABC transporter permease n=1 Tax=unclassified Microbacterium TaxID=2609290 RepID=UPI00214AA406|nr:MULTISPECIES: carbohydrate ABC transporter permease [unclassified Microbacterium]MCR2784806.1 carbohydrate ABC transporter permease [Microbacterium sp. zg.B96]MDL5352742.1 carbohydrate ABC transporter permease [Microbacterium sp. zg-YB36]WIM16345.1 carbohydrate ABC transporter permease [Microbacterium sp. zg-B96]
MSAKTSAVRGRRPIQRRSPILTLVVAMLGIYTLLPLAYLVINASKSSSDFFSTFGLSFGSSFELFNNIGRVFAYDDGVFARWFGNTLIYVVLGGAGSAIISTLAGYGIAKYAFRGRRALFAVIIGAVAIPGTALALPTFLLFSNLGMTNTIWAVIIPSLVNPFGLYLTWVYATEAVPDQLLEAARLDGSGEFRTFWSIALRLLGPGFVTVLLFSVVATWNNYFLPLIMLTDPKLYPLTVGLAQWNAQSTGTNAEPIQTLVLTGSLLAVIPLIVVFLLLQRFWQSGLAAGSVKQ